MTDRLALMLLGLLPLAAAAQTGSAPGPALEDRTIEQLCDLREDPLAWAELERREQFTDRELRSIEQERVRTRIRESALFCFMGKPDSVVGLLSAPGGQWVDAYTYDVDVDEPLVVHVFHGAGEATVVRAMKASDAAYEPQVWAREYCRGFLCQASPGCQSVSSGQSLGNCAYGQERQLASRSLAEQRDAHTAAGRVYD